MPLPTPTPPPHAVVTADAARTAVSLPSLAIASRLAKEAVEHDRRGNLEQAADAYAAAAVQLACVLRECLHQLSSEQLASLEQRRLLYDRRSKELKARIESVLPSPPSHNVTTTPVPLQSLAAAAVAEAPEGQAGTLLAAATTGLTLRQQQQQQQQQQQPSVIDVGLMAVATANREGGKYLLAGAKHAGEAASATIAAAAAADAKYNIRERVSETVSTTLEAARSTNEKHRIIEKVGTVAAASATKLAEINREYRITDRIGETLVSGLNYAAGVSSDYLSASVAQPKQVHSAGGGADAATAADSN